MTSARTSNRLDDRHCASGAKETEEKEVTLRQRKTTPEGGECRQGE
jgi:hypothetical protein